MLRKLRYTDFIILKLRITENHKTKNPALNAGFKKIIFWYYMIRPL